MMTEQLVAHAYFVSYEDGSVTFDVIGADGGLHSITLGLLWYSGELSDFDVPVGTEACIRYESQGAEYRLLGIDFDCNEMLHRKVHRLQQDNLETQKKLIALEVKFRELEKELRNRT